MRNSREVGLGNYRRESDGRGYVTQDFGVDTVYPPVIIENEAVTLSHTITASNSIHVGANAPLADLGDSLMSTTRDSVTIYEANGSGLPKVQFSLGWAADDTFETFSLLWGTGQRITESAAWGGTAYQLTYTSTIESSAWVWTTDFVRDTPMTAYVRLKISDNSSSSEVARVSVTNGATLSLKGTDFTAVNQYQEFPLEFTFPSSETFLTFQFWRSGLAAVTIDGVSIFTASQPATSTTTWAVPGGNYRGQGVWIRYTDDAGQFTPFSEADTRPRFLTATPTSLFFFAVKDGAKPPPQTLNITRGCASFSYQISDDAGWLLTQINGDEVQVNVNQAGLSVGPHHATITLEAGDMTPVSIPVTMFVVEQVYELYLPVIMHSP